jgi:hypothetical protein
MFDSVTAALGVANDLDPKALTDRQLADGLVALERARALLDAVSSKVLAAFEQRGIYGHDGAVSASAWVEHRARTSGGMARRRVKVARALQYLALVREAVSQGRLTFEHAALFAAAQVPATEAAMQRDEAALVAHAEELSVDAFARLIRRWRELADVDGSHDQATDRARRFLRMSSTLDGTWIISGRLDAASGAIVFDALEGISEELYRGEERDFVQDADDGRPRLPSQRRADALVELTRRAAVADAQSSKAARPLITLVVRSEDLAAGRGGETDRGVVVPGATVRRLACDASIAAVVLDSLGEPIDLGRSTRVPSAAQRRALVVRDRGCVFPGCDRPPGWCDVHHLVPWVDGGPTDLENAALFCGRHHHLMHEHGWRVVRRPDGRLEFFRSDGSKLEPTPRWSMPTG